MIALLLCTLVVLSGSSAFNLAKPGALLKNAHGKLLEVVDQRETELIRHSLQAQTKSGVDTAKFRIIANKMIAQKDMDLGAFGPMAYKLMKDALRLEQASPIGSAARIEQVQKSLLRAWDEVIANKDPYKQHYRPRIFRRDARTNGLVGVLKNVAKSGADSDGLSIAKGTRPDFPVKPSVAVHEPHLSGPHRAD